MFLHKILLRTLLASTLFAGLGFFSFAQKTPLRVAAASDLQMVMPQIAKAFEAQTQIRVDVTYGSSGNFFAQLQNGAPFDLFFSADSEYPLKLIQADRAEPRSALVYGIGGLVLWMPPNSKCDPQAEHWDCLSKPFVSRIAIANPAHAPYGRAAVEAMQSAHLYEQVRGKLVLGENISQAAQFVQSGNAQAGLIAYSLAHSAAMRVGKQWEIPRDSYPAIEQTAVILKASQQQSAAADFMKFATEGPGHALLEQFGFQPPPSPIAPHERHK